MSSTWVAFGLRHGINTGASASFMIRRETIATSRSSVHLAGLGNGNSMCVFVHIYNVHIVCFQKLNGLPPSSGQKAQFGGFIFLRRIRHCLLL
jgi:hypothetical protein